MTLRARLNRKDEEYKDELNTIIMKKRVKKNL
jgi:hypothetical protein